MLKQMEQKLSDFVGYLENCSSGDIYDFFDSARQFRDSISDHGQGFYPLLQNRGGRAGPG